MRKLLLVVVFATSCATLSTWGMSERCKDLYNACLNGCPRPPPGPPDKVPDWQPQIASCTDQCNKQASSCK